MEGLPGPARHLVLGYGATAAGDVLSALHPPPACLKVEFAGGVELPDPAGLLEDTGQRLRHANVRTPADVEPLELRMLLEVAVRLCPR